MTHVPVLSVPPGCVNVHGHMHEAASPTRNRHINVCVEQLAYRPARLSDVRLLARRLVEHDDMPEHTTATQIEIARVLAGKQRAG